MQFYFVFALRYVYHSPMLNRVHVKHERNFSTCAPAQTNFHIMSHKSKGKKLEKNALEFRSYFTGTKSLKFFKA